MMEMKALCVIDVQVDYMSPRRKDALSESAIASLVTNINRAILQAEEKAIPVIYVRQVHATFMARALSKLFGGGLAMAGTPGIALDPRIKKVSNNVFDKEMKSAFSSYKFVNHLKQGSIDHLYLAGLDGCQCVGATAKAARSKGMQVTLVTSAIASSFPDRWKTLQGELQLQGVRLQDMVVAT
jgi:nicotinamidase-related amidase